MMSFLTSFDSITCHPCHSNLQYAQKKRNQYASNTFKKENFDFEAANAECEVCLEFRNFDMVMQLRFTTVRFSR